jgi:hypothetical protein
VEALLGSGVTTEFDSLLVQETQYWTHECVSLRPGWWLLTSPRIEAAKDHYNRLFAMLVGIGELKLTRYLPAIRRFRIVWSKCPSFRNARGEQDRLTEECDRLLGKLGH